MTEHHLLHVCYCATHRWTMEQVPPKEAQQEGKHTHTHTELIITEAGGETLTWVSTGTHNRDSQQLDESTRRCGTKIHQRATQKTNRTAWFSVNCLLQKLSTISGFREHKCIRMGSTFSSGDHRVARLRWPLQRRHCRHLNQQTFISLDSQV